MLKGTVRELLHEKIRHSPRVYWECPKTETLQGLARFATLFRSLHSEPVSPATTSSPSHMQACPDRKCDCSHQKVMMTDSSGTNKIKTFLTKLDLVMVISNGSTATPLGPTPTTRTSFTVSLDTEDRCWFWLHGDHCETACRYCPGMSPGSWWTNSSKRTRKGRCNDYYT